MGQRTLTSRRAILGLLGAGTVAVLAACAGGVAQSEVDAVKKQLADEQDKTKTLQQQLSAAQAKAAGTSTLLGVQKLPPAPPPPTPTPLPAGAAPPAKPAPPAALYDSVGPYSFYVETLATNHSKENFAATVACIPNALFKRGMMIVWRFEVIDIAAGKRLTDRDGATVNVHLPHGEDVAARFTQRGGGAAPDAPWMWGAGWDIPLDYPLGGFNYSIVVNGKDGKTGTFKPPALILPGKEDSRVQIVE